ncbi:hypothetical protein ANACOL_00432 [Anaerotruncus colihominis DSM 17241]|uniref:Uncharacterized protein n=1 Tax=Anaerotruncus colihominis DSM 17241 TaxID=445972 RepID=B0P6Q4_9FIRM|nr:hypothetical protein ANACOL_00432 [Anaerotruncus colihominis DSM 17241]
MLWYPQVGIVYAQTACRPHRLYSINALIGRSIREATRQRRRAETPRPPRRDGAGLQARPARAAAKCAREHAVRTVYIRVGRRVSPR